jgi:hypothetical protein
MRCGAVPHPKTPDPHRDLAHQASTGQVDPLESQGKPSKVVLLEAGQRDNPTRPEDGAKMQTQCDVRSCSRRHETSRGAPPSDRASTEQAIRGVMSQRLACEWLHALSPLAREVAAICGRDCRLALSCHGSRGGDPLRSIAFDVERQSVSHPLQRITGR